MLQNHVGSEITQNLGYKNTHENIFNFPRLK